MTITINQTFLYYWLFAIIFETIYNYITFTTEWSKFKKRLEAEEYAIYKELFNQYKQMSSIQLIWRKVFNPMSYFVGYIIFCIVTPIILPMSLITLFKKLIGYKSDLQKRAEMEGKRMEEANEREHEWMKNEGIFTEKEEFDEAINS